MQQSRFFTFVGFCIAAVITLWMSVFVVYPRQQVIIKRFEEIVRVENQPGLYFKLPFVEQVVIVDASLRRSDLETITLQVNSGALYEVDAFFTYRITDARLFLQKISSGRPDVMEMANLKPRFDAALRRVYGKRAFDAAFSSERNTMMREVQEQIAKDAQSLGVTIVDVRIRKTDLTRKTRASTYKRMEAERYEKAEEARAFGRAEKERIIAQAQREYAETLAKAKSDAARVRGEGEAERARLLLEARAAAPEFYDFWRSMEAYKKSSDVPFIMTPDAPFFRYLFQPQTATGGR